MINEVIDYISAYKGLPSENISKETHLIRDLYMESLDLLQLVSVMEEDFKIEFNVEDMPVVLTVEEIASYIDRQTS